MSPDPNRKSEVKRKEKEYLRYKVDFYRSIIRNLGGLKIVIKQK